MMPPSPVRRWSVGNSCRRTWVGPQRVGLRRMWLWSVRRRRPNRHGVEPRTVRRTGPSRRRPHRQRRPEHHRGAELPVVRWPVDRRLVVRCRAVPSPAPVADRRARMGGPTAGYPAVSVHRGDGGPGAVASGCPGPSARREVVRRASRDAVPDRWFRARRQGEHRPERPERPGRRGPAGPVGDPDPSRTYREVALPDPVVGVGDRSRCSTRHEMRVHRARPGRWAGPRVVVARDRCRKSVRVGSMMCPVVGVRRRSPSARRRVSGRGCAR